MTCQGKSLSRTDLSSIMIPENKPVILSVCYDFVILIKATEGKELFPL